MSNQYNLTIKFDANNKTWITDEETYKLMCQYRKESNNQMLAYVFEIGKGFGRIVESA